MIGGTFSVVGGIVTAIGLAGLIIIIRRIVVSKDRAASIGGVAAFGALLTGIFSLLIAFISIANNSGDFAALCFIAAALSFGLLANAAFRQ